MEHRSTSGLRYGERRQEAGGVALSFNSQGGNATQLLGILAIVGSCLAWALDNLTTQRLSERDPFSLMATKCMLVGPLGLALALASGHAPPARAGLIAAIAIGVFAWAGSMVCFALAMRHLGAAKVGSLLALSPFAGAIGSIVGLAERPTLAIGVAGLLMAIGAFCLARGHLAQPVQGGHRETIMPA